VNAIVTLALLLSGSIVTSTDNKFTLGSKLSIVCLIVFSITEDNIGVAGSKSKEFTCDPISGWNGRS
jgi:hypothetical protein